MDSSERARNTARWSVQAVPSLPSSGLSGFILFLACSFFSWWVAKFITDRSHIMIEIWYAILAFTLIVYVTLDGRNFGAGLLHLIVARTPTERRQGIAAIGPLWSWHEVWLVAFGGVMFVAFPRLLGVAFSGYYLALFLVLWSLILRGISLEVGGHIDDRMWQSFWDFVFPASNL